jgi:hypothetical protein
MGIGHGIQAIPSHSKSCNSPFGVKLAINRKYKPQVGTKCKFFGNSKSQRSTHGSATRLDLVEGMSGAGRW